jgi:hypothetical protein
MAGISSAVCDSFKAESWQAVHNFTTTTGNVFKIALVKVSPTGTYGQGTTNYSDLTGNSDEVSGTGYSAGGFAWTAAQNITPAITNHVATTSWSVNPSWSGATFSTIGGIIYNSSQSNKAVGCYSFGGTQTVTAGTLTLVLPTNNDTLAILRMS